MRCSVYLVLIRQKAQLLNVSVPQPFAHLACLLLPQFGQLSFVTTTRQFDVALQYDSKTVSDQA